MTTKKKAKVKKKKPTVISRLSAKLVRTKTGPALKRYRDVLSRKNMDGSVAIMRLDNDRFFYSLDGIAAEIWTLIDGKTSLTEIQSKVIAKHHPPLSRFEKDVEKLIKELRKEKLLQA